jgi:hypothetical protein
LSYRVHTWLYYNLKELYRECYPKTNTKIRGRMGSTAAVGKDPVSSLAGARRVFSMLALPDLSQVSGRWQAEFTGPGWLRWLAPRAIALGGMPGWWGKDFLGGGLGRNLQQRNGVLSNGLPIQYSEAASLQDGRPCMAVRYGSTGPVPWRWVVDEFRQLDAGCLLGMTVVDAPLLRQMGFPFLLLQKKE